MSNEGCEIRPWTHFCGLPRLLISTSGNSLSKHRKTNLYVLTATIAQDERSFHRDNRTNAPARWNRLGIRHLSLEPDDKRFRPQSLRTNESTGGERPRHSYFERPLRR